MLKPLLLTISHVFLAAVGFMAGVYALPIIVEPPTPPTVELQMHADGARFTGTFRRNLPGSDFLHWGEGTLAVGPAAVSMRGELTPGPDYKLYLSPEPVATAAEFQAVKARAVALGDVRSFHGFVIAVPPSVDVARYDTAVIWCETFAKFITAAQYR
jgi:hypothetical protein